MYSRILFQVQTHPTHFVRFHTKEKKMTKRMKKNKSILDLQNIWNGCYCLLEQSKYFHEWRLMKQKQKVRHVPFVFCDCC